MTRLEYLKKEVVKYGLLSALSSIGYIVHFGVLLFLIVHMLLYWNSHDYLTILQVLKYSFANFWFLYVYVICFVFFGEKLKSCHQLCLSFRKQLNEEEKNDSTRVSETRDADKYELVRKNEVKNG